MAYGDSKPSRSSYGGLGSTYQYDDEGRGRSKTLWEEFERSWTEAEFSKDWLLPLGWNTEGVDPGSVYSHEAFSDQFLYNCINAMRDRYTVHDWAWNRFEDYDSNDGRVRRLVISKHDIETWQTLQRRARLVKERIEQKKKEQAAERAEKESQQFAKFRVDRIRREEEARQTVSKNVDLTAGALRSSFHDAYEAHTYYGRDEGDFIDDPVAAYHSGKGFGYEDQRATGIKLQVTVSLDLSNSMVNNRIYEETGEAWRDIYLALKQLETEFRGDLFTAAFLFSYDTTEDYKDSWGDWKTKQLPGRGANVLHERDTQWEDGKLGPVDKYVIGGFSSWMFSGTDTWFYPLFEEIENWEKENSDSGAHRLDLILTDAVLEHPSDIRRSDEIQERRDGSLQTIFLNFLPEYQWVNSDLPLRCVQYPANKADVPAMLRTLIQDFVGAFV